MPDLAFFHPQVVHFTIALLAVGVALRWVSLTGKAAFTGPAAVTLLLLGTVAAVVGVSSGVAAHQPVERIPGVAPAVQVHEDWGIRTRNVFLGVAVLELLGLAFARRRPGWRRGVEVASAVVGLLGSGALYVTAQRGGALVYSYAGGPGLRSGDTTDIERLLIAGLYQQAMVERARHQPANAAELIDQLSRRVPGDAAVELLRIESLLLDRRDPPAALAALGRLAVPADNRRLAIRAGMLAADAYEAAGMPDSARARLRRLAAEFPAVQRIRDRLAKLGS